MIFMGKRFETTVKQGTLEVVKIIRDNETGVQYLVHHAGYGSGMTVLVDQDGKPLLDKPDK